MFGAAPIVAIGAYEFSFRPFAYRMNLEGRVEIRGRYRLGVKMLSGRLILPNQTIELIDLVPNPGADCRVKSRNCRVFTFSTFIQLSGDRYFSREFSEEEEVPLRFTLDFDSSNLDLFRRNNPSLGHWNRHSSDDFGRFLSRLKLLKIEAKLRYRNSFTVERRGGHNSSATVQLPVSWTIRDGVQSTQYSPATVLMKNYDGMENQFIRDWFSVVHGGRVELDAASVVLRNGTALNIPVDSMVRIRRGDLRPGTPQTSYHLRGSVERTGSEYRHLPDIARSGIFLRGPDGGVLSARLYLYVNDHGYVLRIRNPFSFREGPDDSRSVRVWIRSRRDGYFSNPRRFRFFTL